MHQMPASVEAVSTPVGLTPRATLATLLEQLAADPGLSANRRRDLTSAVRRLAELLHRDPSDVAAEARTLRPLIAGLHPVQCGVAPKTLQNIRAGVSAVLKRYGTGKRGPAPGKRLPEPWCTWHAALPTDGDRYALSRLMRWCADHGIAPEAVDDAVMVGFGTFLEETLSARRPRSSLRLAIATWNQAVERVPGWPGRRLSPLERPRAYTLPWNQFPASLRQDMEAWLHRLSGADLLAEDGPPRPANPVTLNTRRFQVLQLASALVLQGGSTADLRSLADLVDVDRAREALRFFLDRAAGKPTSMINQLAATLVAIARHWVKVEAPQLAALRKLAARVKMRQQGLTEKNRSRLAQFDSDRNKGLLLGFGEQVRAELRRRKEPDLKGALVLQAAVAVEILLMAPIRLRNLVGLSLDRHLIRPRERRGETVLILIPPEEVKNRQPLLFELQPRSRALLDLYLDRYRPLLLKHGPSQWLFPGALPARHRAEASLARLLIDQVQRRTGLRVNPHLFRHLAAKLYLETQPGEYEVMRRVLGHRSMATTANHYAGLETAAAVRRYDAVILGEAERLGVAAPVGRGNGKAKAPVARTRRTRP